MPFCLGLAGAAAGDTDALQERVAAALRRSFPDAKPEEWKTRLDQDQAQALCSRYRNAPPAEIAASITAQGKAAMRYPHNGKLLGDWRKGEQIAAFSSGGQLSRLQPDPAEAQRGGNCFACHVLTRDEVAAGNLGPSLRGYAKLRGTAHESARYTYEKIYNAQASLACSFMPRFGHNGWLTPDQVADLTAFLLDPQSGEPMNTLRACAVSLFAWASIISGLSPAHAQDDALERARQLFDKYVALGAAYDPSVADLYSDSAFIKNTRRSPDGESRSMTLPALTYKSLIREVMPKAKEAGDSSSYSDVKYIPDGQRVRIEATRYSNMKKYSSPFVLVVGPAENGTWLIFEEIGESRP